MNEPREEHDDDLRQLFQDAAADIRPQGSLEDIQRRTKKVDPMTRRWFLPVVAAAAVMGMVIGGAVWIAHDSNDPRGGIGPVGTPTPTTGTATAERAVPVYFVGRAARGQRLFREFQREQTCSTGDCMLESSARTAVGGVPDDPDYTNPWPDGSTVKSATYDGNVLTVDLHLTWPEQAGNGPDRGSDQALAVQQLVYSAQAGLGKGRVPVQLLVDGQKVPKILGVSTDAPVQADDEASVLAPVQISSPSNGMTVSAGDVTVTGVASAFEANVVWELMVGGDAVVQNGHTTAAECCKLSPYEFTLKNLQPGTYTIVVHDEDMSGSGKPVNQDTKDFVVQ